MGARRALPLLRGLRALGLGEGEREGEREGFAAAFLAGVFLRVRAGDGERDGDRDFEGVFFFDTFLGVDFLRIRSRVSWGRAAARCALCLPAKLTELTD